VFNDKIAVVSSFGTEAAALLWLVSKVDPDIPVLFVDTGMHFSETLEYKARLTKLLGLTNIRTIYPSEDNVYIRDPDSNLHQTNDEACCDLRRVEPLKIALQPFAAWVNGRKGYQEGRAGLSPVEEEDGENQIQSAGNMDQVRDPECLQEKCFAASPPRRGIYAHLVR